MSQPGRPRRSRRPDRTSCPCSSESNRRALAAPRLRTSAGWRTRRPSSTPARCLRKLHTLRGRRWSRCSIPSTTPRHTRTTRSHNAAQRRSFRSRKLRRTRRRLRTLCRHRSGCNRTRPPGHLRRTRAGSRTSCPCCNRAARCRRTCRSQPRTSLRQRTPRRRRRLARTTCPLCRSRTWSRRNSRRTR
jgi:hypothetical protein